MRSREGWWRGRCALVALVLGACAGPSGVSVSRVGNDVPPEVTATSILAPVRGDGLSELAWLRRAPPSPAAELRRAHILTQLGDGAAAIAVLNLVLYGEVEPSPPVEAFARYLRAAANDLVGNDDDARADRERALALAVDPDLRALLGPAEPPPAPPPVARAPVPSARPDILPRASWGARPADRGDLRPMERPYRITIHHTAIATHSTSQKASAAQIYSVQGGHQSSEGWADIGYHFLVDRAGRVWEGRPLRWQGAHAGGDNNRGNIGICLLGRFLRTPDGQDPSPEQRAALERMLRWLCDEHDIAADQIHFHRRFKSTECPGPRLETAVNEIRRRMQQVAQR